jgi:arylsulfatase A-like enzyme
MIVLDTQRRDRLSLYGYGRTTSPALDDFATRATVYERAIAPAQWTIPAHGSLFTGLYPAQHGFTQAFQTLSDAHPTLAELLQLSDYHTVAFCNNPLVGVLDNGLQRGFDAFYNYAGASPNRPREAGAFAGLRARFERFARYVSNRFAHSDTLFRWGLHPLITPIWTRLANYKGSTAHSLADLQAYWLRHVQTQAQQPLFAYVNLMGVHMPLRPSRRTLERVAPDVARSRASRAWMNAHNADGVGWISPLEAPLEDWQQHALTAYYDACIVEQDALLGQALEALRARHALDNTVVLILADHGEGHGDHHYFGHSFVVYQELVHVPMTIYAPEHLQAGRVSANVSTRRVFHTLLDVAQATTPFTPDDPNGKIAELSLFNGQAQEPFVYSEAVPPINLLNIMTGARASLVQAMRLRDVRRGVYHGDDKLITVGADVEGVYNVAQDPAEAHNLQAHANGVGTRLQAQLSAFVAQQARPMAALGRDNGYSPDVLDNLRALGYLE